WKSSPERSRTSAPWASVTTTSSCTSSARTPGTTCWGWASGARARRTARAAPQATCRIGADYHGGADGERHTRPGRPSHTLRDLKEDEPVSRARTASVVIVMAAMVGAAGCGGGSQTDTPAQQGPTSLQIEDLVVGTGATVVAGDTITVNYVGTFLDGRVFDQNNGISFQVGVGKLIKGWDQGIPGMKVGGKRRLTVPS